MNNNTRSTIKDAMLARRILLVQGTFTDQTKDDLLLQLLYLNTESEDPITLYIDTPGGYVPDSLHVIDAIERSRSKVVGMVMGCAISAGFRILQSCHTRLAYPHAILMFHGPTVIGTPMDGDEWGLRVERAKKYHENQIALYAQRSGVDEQEVRKWSKAERRMTAQEALSLNFIDKIVDAPVPH